MSDYYTKHTPKTISECVLPNGIQAEFFKIEKTGQIPNMLFYGSCGIGKSLVSRLLSEEALVLRCDGVGQNSETIRYAQGYATTANMLSDEPKVLVLDELDCLSTNAQEKIRALMDLVGNHCSFIATTNHPHKVLPALRSRLQPICFDVSAKDVTLRVKWEARLRQIFKMENGCEVERTRLDAAMGKFPDARRMITTCLTGIV